MPEAVGGRTDHKHVLVDVIDGVEDQLDGDGERLTVGEIVASLNDRGFGALCAVIGALAAMPVIGALPGVSVGAAVLVLLIAGQYVVGRRSLWIPTFLAKRSFERATFEKGLKSVRPYARWIDRAIRPRLLWFVGGHSERRLIAAAISVLALVMLPLALIPWGVFPPALAITAFGIAITGRDGLFALIGYAFVAVTVYMLYAFSGAIADMVQAI